MHSTMVQHGWSLVVWCPHGDECNAALASMHSTPNRQKGVSSFTCLRETQVSTLCFSVLVSCFSLLLSPSALPFNCPLFPQFIHSFVFRCCQQIQRNHGRCTVQPRIVREGVSALWWRPSSPCVHGTPAPNN